MGFLTAAAICCTSFLVGVLATSLLWDTTLLFGTAGPVNEQTIRTVEAYYLSWWNGAQVVKTLLHVMIVCDYAALVLKFARKADEAAFWFSGSSLLALVLSTSCYITITVPYIRNIAYDPLDASRKSVGQGNDLFTTLQGFFTRTNTGVIGQHAREMAEKAPAVTPMTWDQRLEHDSVLSAANTIMLVFLVGVIILQIGEWSVSNEATRNASAPTAAITPVSEEKKKQ